MQFPFFAIATLEGGLGSYSWTLHCCKAILSVQYLHIAPCGLELQEEESNYCIKENPEKWEQKMK